LLLSWRVRKDLDAPLAYMSHPTSRRKHIGTANLIERSFQEAKRRVKVMEQLNPASVSCSPCFKRKTRSGKVALSDFLEIASINECYKKIE
jgi:transposase-like protein